MGISSIFARMKLPNKTGKLEKTTSQRGSIKYNFLIQIVGFEGNPTYELSSSLSLGSESADIIIEDETISPRHCTFILNQDVVLLMDHASEKGTFIGKTKLAAGKSYIITEKDKLKIGEVDIRLIKVEVAGEASDEKIEENEEEELIEEIVKLDSTTELEAPPSDLAEDKTQDIDLSLLKDEISETEQIGESARERKKREKALLKEKKKKEKEEKKRAKKDQIRYSSGSAANALIRVLALGVDLAFFYLLLSFYGQEELVSMISEIIPIDHITGLFLIELETLVPNLNELFLSFSIEEPKAFMSLCLSLYSIFFIYRLVTTLIFKVSLGQLLLGLNVRGNALSKRFLGLIREIFFLLLSPAFFLTHIGTLVSKRSLEEVLSGTRIEVMSSFKTTILTVLFVPLMIALVLISPLFKNFDLPHYIIYTDSLSKPQKLEETMVSFSQVMKLGSLQSENILASGTIEESADKKYFYPELIFPFNETSVSVQLKKTFSFAGILRILFSHMYFDTESFPAIRSFATSVDGQVGGFKAKLDDARIMQMGGELNQMLSDFLNPTLEKAPDILFQYGPLFQSIIDFREALSLVVGEKINEIELSYFGKTPVVILKTGTIRNKLYFFPLGIEKTPLYQASLRGGNFDQALIEIRKNIFNGFIFTSQKTDEEDVAIAAPEAVDVLSQIVAGKEASLEKVFKFYFEKAKKIINEKEPSELVLSSLDKTLRLIDKANSEGNYSYLYQSLSEIKNALSSMDEKYFEGSRDFNSQSR